ncbi:purine-nucleoside phosphorylase [bacterium]|nr:purine-nucleoside phosphorylase [candidate division CSSED10-310 bacterium]
MAIYLDRIRRAEAYLASLDLPVPRWCIILGSGLGGISERLKKVHRETAFERIPGFSGTSVEGHDGKLVFGSTGKTEIAVMEGRYHLYEGHDPRTVVLPIRVLLALGVSRFFITNAAGGIRSDLNEGDTMMIRDHLNLTGYNPLTGPNLKEWGPRFPAMNDAWDPVVRRLTVRIAGEIGIACTEGVYAALAGPCYESGAEIRMLRTLGADAVGMSTVPEMTVIRQAGCTVAGLSLITNIAGTDIPPDHGEVVDVASARKPVIHQLILEVVDCCKKEVSP